MGRRHELGIGRGADALDYATAVERTRGNQGTGGGLLQGEPVQATSESSFEHRGPQSTCARVRGDEAAIQPNGAHRGVPHARRRHR